MKKLLILFAVVLLAACNQPVKQTSRGPADWIWVSTTGDDVTGNGTIGTPYLTIAKGITEASAGDTVFVVAGTYSIATQVAVPVGITLYTSQAVTLTAGAALNPMFLLSSATENTNGNQSISGFTFDGDSLGMVAIQVKARGHVKIHGNTFNEFLTNGVRLTGKVASSDGPPTNAAESNEVYDNTFTECGGEVFSNPYYFASAAISLGGQKDVRVHDNTIYNNVGNNAYGINSNNQGYNRGAWIYDNHIYTSPKRMADNQWNFAIELWNNNGGIIVKNNYVTGGIDFGGQGSDDSTSYGFALLIQDNVIEKELTAYLESGILLESDMEGGVIVQRNRVRGFSQGVALNILSGPNDVQSDITIVYNLFLETLRTTGNYSGRGIFHGTAVSGAVVNRLKIFNNVFYAETYISSAGIHFASAGVTYNDLGYNNNIFYKQYNPIRFENNTIAGLEATHNIYHLNNSKITYVSVTASDTTTTGNIAANPLFKSNETFRLRPTSPAIDSGIDVGLTTDYWGHRVPQNGTPDIGACEVGNYVLFYNGKQLY